MKHELEMERMRQEHEMRMMQRGRDRQAELQRQEAAMTAARTAQEPAAKRAAKEEWERQWLADFEQRRDGGRENQHREHEALEHERKALVMEQTALRSTDQAITLLKHLDRDAYQTQRPAFEQLAAEFVKRLNDHNQRVNDYHARWGLTATDQPQMEPAGMTEAAATRLGGLHDPRAERLK